MKVNKDDCIMIGLTAIIATGVAYFVKQYGDCKYLDGSIDTRKECTADLKKLIDDAAKEVIVELKDDEEA